MGLGPKPSAFATDDAKLTAPVADGVALLRLSPWRSQEGSAGDPFGLYYEVLTD